MTETREVIAALQNFIRQGGIIYITPLGKVSRNCSNIDVGGRVKWNGDCKKKCKWEFFCGTHGSAKVDTLEKETEVLNHPIIRRVLLYAGLLERGLS